eukprot:TRINITY_DN45656_c0_g1_i1.p1 TRINITY_DN45656_c0_g1~~TRINITY_DN45656_c0_g1_i1.p1  ORF type:complete len:362 (-),score=47.82 TRINITY_DN45656_c0_g1_i1:250-1281(-)
MVLVWRFSLLLMLFEKAMQSDGWRRPKNWLYEDASKDVVLLSGHVGPKFWGLGPLLRRNKRRFAQRVGVPHVFFVEEMVIDDTWTQWLELDDGSHAGDWTKYQAIAAVFRRWRPTYVVWVDGDSWLNPAAKSWASFAEASCCGAAKLVVGSDSHGIDTAVFSLRQGYFAEAMLELLLEEPGNLKDQEALYEHYNRNGSWPEEFDVLPIENSSMLQCSLDSKFKIGESFKCTADSWISHWDASQWIELVVHALDHQMSVSDSLAGIGILDYTKRCLEGTFCSAALGAFPEFCDLVDRDHLPRLHPIFFYSFLALLIFRYQIGGDHSKKHFGTLVGRLRAFAQIP